MPNKSTLLTIALIVSSSYTLADSEAYYDKSAREHVHSYLAMRRACSITKGEQRQECFKLLSAATENYKRAKKELAMQQSAQEESPLISQTQ